MASLTDFVPPAPTLKTSSIISFSNRSDASGSGFNIYENNSGGDQIVFIDFLYLASNEANDTHISIEADQVGTNNEIIVICAATLNNQGIQFPVQLTAFEDDTNDHFVVAGRDNNGDGVTLTDAHIAQNMRVPIPLVNTGRIRANEKSGNSVRFSVGALGRVYNM